MTNELQSGTTKTTGRSTTAIAPVAILGLILASYPLSGHIVPPERLHPVAESYRQMTFLLNLNPIPWVQVTSDAETIERELCGLAPRAAQRYGDLVRSQIVDLNGGEEPPSAENRRHAAAAVFELSTRAVAQLLLSRLEAASSALAEHDSYGQSAYHLEQARQIWASFEPEVRATDKPAHRRLGISWLELAGALGHPGVAGVGVRPADREVFRRQAAEIAAYVSLNYGPDFAVGHRRLSPLPRRSPSFDVGASVPVKLPPAANLNKQLPRPRQILNMAVRGVDEGETALIALGDMAFDSSYIFGEPARTLQVSCNTCHNKSITNPGLFIPGLSRRPGGIDVTNSFFAPHANNGHFDPLDIPDLRGIRFTAPYGRNGRLSSLREFVRNVIVHEFNGPEPDPLLLDGMIAYMNEFDFLPNPALRADGSLVDEATTAAKRGEEIFHRPFAQMGNRSCATCHVPSDAFLDRKRHDIGTVLGSEPYSRDRALDTPTLLSSKYTAPYFHDGSQPTLQSVVEWFDASFGLALNAPEIGDLTAYLELVGDGVEGYEDTPYTLEAELEEFSFFLSTDWYLKQRKRPELVSLTFETVATEIRAHKWDLQRPELMPVLDQMTALMEEALGANRKGDLATVERSVAEYRRLYEENADALK